MEALYPLFLKLQDAPCLVVGGGAVGARKAQDLVETGARVTLVSPAVADAWQELLAHVTHRERVFQPGDASGMRLVFACTGLPDVDDAVAADARAAGALVNAADRIVSCDFFAGSVVRRGPVQVAISTGGESPALARKLRQRLAAVLPAAVGDLARALGDVRPRLLSRYPVVEQRALALDRFVERALTRLSGETTRADVDGWIEAELLEQEV